MEAIETFEHAGCVCELHYDETPQSPAEWDALGTLVHWHRQYDFGHENIRGHAALERGGPRMYERYLRLCEGAIAVLPVGMLDHSGVTLYAGGGAHWSDSAGWDSGTVGFIYTTAERCKELGCDDPEAGLRSELREWAAYMEGRVIGYVVRSGGRIIDSCWGFYPDEEGDGFEYVRAEARAAAESEARERDAAALIGIATREE